MYHKGTLIKLQVYGEPFFYTPAVWYSDPCTLYSTDSQVSFLSVKPDLSGSKSVFFVVVKQGILGNKARGRYNARLVR